MAFDSDSFDTQAFSTDSWLFDLVAGPVLKYWDGAQWVVKTISQWDGNNWTARTLKYWNGSQWV